MGFVADIKDATEAIQNMIDILNKLNPDRSVILEVRNLTNNPLTRASQEPSDGGFAELPSSQVGPGEVDVFGSQSSGINKAIQGRVTYESIDRDPMVNVRTGGRCNHVVL
jgi:hypothetical protein